MPVTAAAIPAPNARPGPFGHRPRHLGADGAVGREDLRRDAELPLLGLVGVRDDPTEEVAARAGDVGDGVGDEPAGAGFGDRERQPALEADCLEALGEPDERIAGHRYWCCRLLRRRPAAGTATSRACRVSRARRAIWPFSVKNVAPDEPVRTSIDVVAGERQRLAAW